MTSIHISLLMLSRSAVWRCPKPQTWSHEQNGSSPIYIGHLLARSRRNSMNYVRKWWWAMTRGDNDSTRTIMPRCKRSLWARIHSCWAAGEKHLDTMRCHEHVFVFNLFVSNEQHTLGWTIIFDCLQAIPNHLEYCTAVSAHTLAEQKIATPLINTKSPYRLNANIPIIN